MTRRHIITTVLFLVAFVALQIPFASAAAQGEICGKVYQSDMKTLLGKGEIRIVNAETGEAKSLQVSEGGCYCARGLTIGNYSLSYSDGATEYLLPDKLSVQDKVSLATCLAIGENNSLQLLQTCKVCKEGFPMAGWILIGAGAAGGTTTAAVILLGGGTEAVASPSQP